MKTYRSNWGLGAIPANDAVIGSTGRFQMNVTTSGISTKQKDWIFFALNDVDFLGGQTDVVIGASSVAINGRATPGMKAKDLYAMLVDVIDNYVTVIDASFVVEGTPLPARDGGVSTRDPIAPREEDRPVVAVEPEPDEPTDTGSNGNGNTGSGNNGSDSNGNTGQTPMPLPFPVVGSDGKIFGIKPLYLLLGVGAFFVLKGK